MKRSIVVPLVAALAMTIATPASATSYVVSAMGAFTAVEDPVGGTYLGTITIKSLSAMTFSDTFTFSVSKASKGSVSFLASGGSAGAPTDLDFTSILFNGQLVPWSPSPDPLAEFAFLSGLNVTAGQLNTIVVTYLSRGAGAYTGAVTFNAAVPETSTWAMMLLGFGMAGGALRYRKRSPTFAAA